MKDVKSNNFQEMNIDRLDLPSPPALIQEIQSCLDDENIGSHEVAKIVESDQAFAARILKLVNSPFYGFAGKIVSIEEAITLLGLNAVYQLLLTTTILNSIKIKGVKINPTDFWLHSYAVGVVAKYMFKKMDRAFKSECFMSGILHDIGRLIYMQMDEKKFLSFYSKGEMATNLREEENYFGIDHQELGKVLAQKWNFPDRIINAIGFHHNPEDMEKLDKMVAAVNISDMLCHSMAIGDSYSFYITDFSKVAWDSLKIGYDDLKEILTKSLNEVDSLKNVLKETTA